jgi:hypothetical protein
MKNCTLFLIVLFPAIALNAQTREITATGNWSTASTWLDGLIADVSGESVLMQSNTVVTIQNGESYTIGNYTANNANGITINTGGSLSLSPGSFLAAGNGTTITVNGTFTVNGNFTVQNNVNLIITGSMVVTGNVDMGNNGHLTVSGSVTVGGNFDGGNNTQVTVNASGSVNVAGSVTVDTGSTLNGSGIFHTGSGCTGPSGFCTDGQLPIELVYFKTSATENGIRVQWATAVEKNVSHFEIEKSIDGFDFSKIISIPANGNSKTRMEYDITDYDPYVGNAYYRLIEIDHDGTRKIFQIVSARFEGAKKVNIYPNPLQNGTLNFSLNFIAEGEAEFFVSDITGKLLTKGKTTDYRISVPFSVQPGIYLLIVQANGLRSTRRFSVQ